MLFAADIWIVFFVACTSSCCVPISRGRGDVVVRLLASHQCEPGSIPRCSDVGIVADDANDRQIFSRISRFPRPCIFTSLHHHRLSRPCCKEPPMDYGATNFPGCVEFQPRAGRCWQRDLSHMTYYDPALVDQSGPYLPSPPHLVVSQDGDLTRVSGTQEGSEQPFPSPPICFSANQFRHEAEATWSAISPVLQSKRTLARPRRSQHHPKGRGGLVVRLLASHLSEPGSIPCGVAPGYSHVGIVLDDAAGRRVFSGFSRFLRPCVPALIHTHLTSPSSVLKILILTAAPIAPLQHYPNVQFISNRRQKV
ncbi:hypothetical protein PR048_014696, partial [Dryococelus australis]